MIGIINDCLGTWCTWLMRKIVICDIGHFGSVFGLATWTTHFFRTVGSVKNVVNKCRRIEVREKRMHIYSWTKLTHNFFSLFL